MTLTTPEMRREIEKGIPAAQKGGGARLAELMAFLEASFAVGFALQKDGGLFEDEGDGVFRVGIAEGVGF